MFLVESLQVLTFMFHGFRIGYSMVTDAEQKGFISPGKVSIID